MDTKKYVFIINDAPYGSERPYNALRLAMNLIKREGVLVKVFLIADGSSARVHRTNNARGVLQHRTHGEVYRKTR